MRDYAEVRADGAVTTDDARLALELFEVDELGLDKVDRAILAALCETFGGQPVGLHTLAVAVAEEPETVEEVYEPFLLKAGLLQRTPRGRIATPARTRTSTCRHRTCCRASSRPPTNEVGARRSSWPGRGHRARGRGAGARRDPSKPTIEFRPVLAEVAPATAATRRRRSISRRPATVASCDLAAVEQLPVVPTTTSRMRVRRVRHLPGPAGGRAARYYLGPAATAVGEGRRRPASSSPARAGWSRSTSPTGVRRPGTASARQQFHPQVAITPRATWSRRPTIQPNDQRFTSFGGTAVDERLRSRRRRPRPWRPRPGSPRAGEVPAHGGCRCRGPVLIAR